jgi:hypothetical protein
LLILFLQDFHLQIHLKNEVENKTIQENITINDNVSIHEHNKENLPHLTPELIKDEQVGTIVLNVAFCDFKSIGILSKNSFYKKLLYFFLKVYFMTIILNFLMNLIHF